MDDKKTLEALEKIEEILKAEIKKNKSLEVNISDFNQKLTYKGEIAGLNKALGFVRQLTAPQSQD